MIIGQKSLLGNVLVVYRPINWCLDIMTVIPDYCHHKPLNALHTAHYYRTDLQREVTKKHFLVKLTEHFRNIFRNIKIDDVNGCIMTVIPDYCHHKPLNALHTTTHYYRTLKDLQKGGQNINSNIKMCKIWCDSEYQGKSLKNMTYSLKLTSTEILNLMMSIAADWEVTNHSFWKYRNALLRNNHHCHMNLMKSLKVGALSSASQNYLCQSNIFSNGSSFHNLMWIQMK